MSISVRCTCGKKYQLKNDAAGKKFKCKECSEVVKVPDEQIDDLEDVDDEEDEWDDGEVKLPVRKKKKKKGSKAAAMATGIAWEAAKGAPGLFVRIAGIFVGIVGAPCALWALSFTGSSLIATFTMGSGIAFMMFCWGCFMTVTCLLGVRASFGFGLKVSGEYIWEGTGSVIVGMMIVGFSIICMAVTVVVVMGAIRNARGGFAGPNWAPPPAVRPFGRPGQPAGF